MRYPHYLFTLVISVGLLVQGCASGPKAKSDQGLKTEKNPTSETEAQEIEEPLDEEAIASRSAMQEFNRGVVAYEKSADSSGNHAAAYKHFESSAKMDDSFAIAHYNMGVILEKRGDPKGALAKYLEAFKIDPTLDVAVVNAGILLEMDGQEEAARQLYEESVVRHPESAGPRVRLAMMHHKEDNYRDAALLAREALQFDGSSIEAYRLLARLYAEKKRNNLVRLIALRGQKLSKDDPELLYALAIVAIDEKDVAQSRLLLGKVLDKKPEHKDARLSLIKMAFKNRDWKTASKELQILLEKEPTNASLLVQYGLTMKGQGRFDDAKVAYEKAMTADPELAEARFNLGVLYLRHLYDPVAAEKLLEEYLAASDSPDKVGRKLLKEAKQMIQAKEEEKRMMEEMRRMEEEAARLAEEEAKRQAEEAARLAEEEKARQAAEAAAAAERERLIKEGKLPPEEVATEESKPKKKPKKRKYRKKKSKKKRSKQTGPEEDEGFFD